MWSGYILLTLAMLLVETICWRLRSREIRHSINKYRQSRYWNWLVVTISFIIAQGLMQESNSTTPHAIMYPRSIPPTWALPAPDYCWIGVTLIRNSSQDHPPTNQ